MPRRRLDTALASNILSQVLGVSHPVAKSALEIAQHNNLTRSGHYPYIGAPLTNYKSKSKRVKIPTVSQRRSSPITETIPKNKILSTSKAMPYRRYKRKPFKRSRKSTNRRRRLTNQPWPREKLVKLKVVHSGSLSGNAGALNAYVFKANSLNDPTGTMGAGLTMGVDQLATLYGKYIVIGSRIKVRLHPTTITGACIAGIHLTKDSATLTDHDYYKELPLTSQRMLSPDIDLATIVNKYSAKRFWRLKNIKDDSEQEATFSTSPGSPTDECYYHFYIQDLNKTDNLTVEFQVEIEYICLLSEPTTPARSTL